ncbi:MAG: phage terminase large subunit [Lachnospiraceae bacterium]|nr:phage terminase large subunit [Lachnospiraceae bacterium]
MMTISEKQRLVKLRRIMLKRDAPDRFASFLGYANPKYQAEWFHILIADYCQKLYEGKIKNLMVFVPPQHGKSEIISRNFPAWVLGKNPDMKIVGSSYSSDLADGFSLNIQRTIESEEYQSIFPDTQLNGMSGNKYIRGYKRNEDYFDIINHRGFYKAVGVGKGLTGTPVDIAIIDDPVKDAVEALSPVYRERVWNWYNTVLTTRLHNESRQLFIMTRWHEDDLAGRILKTEPDDWTVLVIPAICEAENDNGLSQRHVGEALWPQRHSLAKLLKQKQRSPRDFSALYQQRPTIEGGNIVKRDWFQRISFADFKALRFKEPVHFYLDTAYNKKKTGSDNDPSGILAACRIKNNIYILHAQSVWKEMPDLLRFLPEYIYAHDGNDESVLHIEPKANGISVVQMLKDTTTLNVKETPQPVDDKEVRFRVVSPRVECGRVYLVDGVWVEDFLNQVCSFPAAAHDEFVDILGYAINDLYEDDDDIDFDNIQIF